MSPADPPAYSDRSFRSIATAAIHAGEPEPRIAGAVVTPIFQSANFIHEGTSDYHATTYVRLANTPSHRALHAKLAALEHGEAAISAASGMAAISAALLAVLRAGDHLLAVEGLYGGTRNLLTEELPALGIEVTFIDGCDPSTWASRLEPTTRAIYMETITNPLMRVPALEEAVAFAGSHGLVSLIDSTLASPVNLQPLELDFDLCLHSCTKYLNGHSDIAAGAVIGRADLVRKAWRRLCHLGGSLDPHACFLLQRGIKTLVLRVRHQNESAQCIAQRLAGHREVEHVSYPGLPDHPDHERARRLLQGFGGMMSVRLHGGVAAAERFLERLTIPIHAASLGGVETLVIRPAQTAYASVPADERRRLGVTDDLIRLSVGIEDTDELWEDLERALGTGA
jgi:cystathionine gamma-synthase/cystathionine gamma-lyase/cystathionine beta-lyase